MFVGIGILGGSNGTTFNNTEFKPTDIGLYLRIGRQHTIARTYLSYTYIDHFGDDNDWVKVGDKQYKAKSHVFSFNADLMPKLPSSPLYGILGFDIGWERLNLEYRDTRSFSWNDLFETRLTKLPKTTVGGLNIGIKGGFAVEFTSNFQLELTGRISKSFLGNVEIVDQYTREKLWSGKPDQMNITGMLGLNIVF